ncbi:hypothetical protein Trydic_g14864 [Trypoxylus dichotomus]
MNRREQDKKEETISKNFENTPQNLKITSTTQNIHHIHHTSKGTGIVREAVEIMNNPEDALRFPKAWKPLLADSRASNKKTNQQRHILTQYQKNASTQGGPIIGNRSLCATPTDKATGI